MNAFHNMKLLLCWIFIFILILEVFSYGSYLIKNKYITECFTSNISSSRLALFDRGTPDTNHNVNQPINTTISCKNICGPLARCSITGEQCTSDVDCFGCMLKGNKIPNYGKNVSKQNGSGKLTGGVTPTYSVLTTDIGTNATLLDDAKKPPRYNQGLNLWRDLYHNGYSMFNERYKPPDNLVYIPKYPTMLTLSGEFTEDGPLASNS
jgi:hypothetical protein